jgi:Dyp-type peroxidase family
MTSLELFDIQGNILRGYGMAYGCHHFVHIDDAADGRAWLARAVERVTTAELQARSEPRLTCNIAVSAAGLAQLEVPLALLAEFPAEFRAGMARRDEVLGVGGESHPDRWKEDVFRSGSAHLAVSVYSDTEERLNTESDRLGAELAVHNLKVLHSRRVDRPRLEREHFGFADGFAQPHIVGAPAGRRPPRSTTSPGSRPLPPGEFLLGYRDLDGALPAGPPGALGRNGTYMVYRELDQDVAGFRRFLRHQSDACGLSEELLAAKIVGRWRNGTPLAVSPDKADLPKGRGDARLDDFGYADDPHGFRCPLGAHIRRANPRDAAGLGLEVTRRHRMIRRGMPYGPRLADGVLVDDGEERGLAFICLVASIERQYELVLEQWCNDGNAFGLGTEADLVLGRGYPGKMTIQGTPPVFVTRSAGQAGALSPFVTTRGGEYFYMPGVAGLRTLAEGTIYG